MFQIFPLIPFTLLIVCVLAIVTFYLAYRSPNKSAFDRILLWGIFYIFLHSFYVFIIEVFYANEPWRDQLIPFAFGYGPFLYFGMLSLRDNKVQLWKLFVHLIPFVVYLILFGLLVCGILENTLVMQKRIGKHIFILGPISFITYAVWSVFAGKGLFKEKFRQKLAMFVFARILLLFISLIFIIIFFSKRIAEDQQAIYLLRMVIYVCMLLAVFMIFSYVVDKLVKPNIVLTKKTKIIETEASVELAKYERSALSELQLIDFEKRLIHAVKEEQLYLDQELSLSSLSAHLRIPNHHLTQVFSVRIKQTFYQYINGFRIIHACELLQSANKMLNLEELAEKSGFNSKVSFNRQFKQVMGCTPSAYRNHLSI
jgi:AraC-like DNA-binding protein